MLSVMSEIPIFKRLSWENTSEMEHFRIISIYFRMLQCAKRRQFMENPRQVAAERETNSHARSTIERQPSWISRQFPVLPPSAHYGLSSYPIGLDSTFIVSVDVFCSLSRVTTRQSGIISAIYESTSSHCTAITNLTSRRCGRCCIQHVASASSSTRCSGIGLGVN